ncbi:hypothetical protein [Diaminobutyricimonas sp. LJ205]|uniref:hypothetical protein n=1 Tax=Diaminobutyricimonas sp. LJ205 TaxID=2683590 RepID=UPI0012F4F157|nr:hypothetical protein [Diaminobutyricimonas sp. LJ205]
MTTPIGGVSAMPQARQSGSSVLSLVLASLGVALGWFVLTVILGAGTAHAADDRRGDPSTPVGSGPAAPTNLVTSLVSPGSEAVAPKVTVVVDLVDPVAETATALIEPVAPVVTPVIEPIAAPIAPVVGSVLEPAVGSVLEPVEPLVEAAIAPLAPLVQTVTRPATPILEPVVDTLVTTVEPGFDSVGISVAQAGLTSEAAQFALASSTSTQWPRPFTSTDSSDPPLTAAPESPSTEPPVGAPVAGATASASGGGAPPAVGADTLSAASVHQVPGIPSRDNALPPVPTFDPGSTPD